MCFFKSRFCKSLSFFLRVERYRVSFNDRVNYF
jgi:hypothetical protein